MNVLKFGGTSLGNAERMKDVAVIVSQQKNTLVVLSAISGSTNVLTDIANAIKNTNNDLAKSSIDILLVAY